MSPLADTTLDLSPSGYFSSRLRASGSRSPSWGHLADHPAHTRPSPLPRTTGTLVSSPCSLLSGRLLGFKNVSTSPSILLPSRGRGGNSCSAPERGRTSQLTLTTEVKVCGFWDRGAKGPGLCPVLSLAEGIQRRARPCRGPRQPGESASLPSSPGGLPTPAPQEALTQLQRTETADRDLLPATSPSFAVNCHVAVDQEHTWFLSPCWGPSSDDVWPKLAAH